MIFTHLVSSHGEQVCMLNDKTEVDIQKLPDNVVVIMNCTNSCINANDVIDAKLWELASSFNILNKIKKLDKMKSIDEMNEVFTNFMEALNKGLNIPKKYSEEFTNEYCFFFNEYPNVEFCSELNKFRSGIYTLPVSIAYETHKNRLFKTLETVQGVFTSDDFGNYPNFPDSQKIKMDAVLKFLKPELNKQKFHGIEFKEYKYVIDSYGSSIKDTILAKSNKGKRIKLSHFIEDLNYNMGDNLFHVIIVATCTVGPKAQDDMKHHFSRPQNSKSFIKSTMKLFQAKIAKFIIKNVNNQCTVPNNLLEFIEEKDAVEDDTDNEVSKIITKQLSNSRSDVREVLQMSSCACSKKNTTSTSTNTSTNTNININSDKNNSASVQNANVINVNSNSNKINYSSKPLIVKPSFLRGIQGSQVNENTFEDIRKYYKGLGYNDYVNYLDKLNYDQKEPVIIPLETDTNVNIRKQDSSWISSFYDNRLSREIEFQTSEIGFVENNNINWYSVDNLSNSQQIGGRKSKKPKVVINLNNKKHVVNQEKGRIYIVKNKKKVYLS